MIRLLFAVLLFLPLQAHADAFFWKDPKSGLTVTFPDTWNKTTNRKAGDVLTIIAPSDNEQPVCTISIYDDHRYVIYPHNYGRSVQRDAVSRPFWESYLGHYDEYNLENVYDGAGLGRWHASYALASYMQRNGTVYQQRRALMFASLYYNKLYILECSALAHGYDNHQAAFQGILKSVDFKKAFHGLTQGEYRNFLTGADEYFWTDQRQIGVSGF